MNEVIGAFSFGSRGREKLARSTYFLSSCTTRSYNKVKCWSGSLYMIEWREELGACFFSLFQMQIHIQHHNGNGLETGISILVWDLLLHIEFHRIKTYLFVLISLFGSSSFSSYYSRPNGQDLISILLPTSYYIT